MVSHIRLPTFMLGFVLSTLTYYLCLMTYKYVGLAVPLETPEMENNYEVAIIMYAVFGGLGWCILAVSIFALVTRKTAPSVLFLFLMVIVWGLLIGLVFVPPHNKWRKYTNYKDAIGTGVATLDCWKNGTTLKLPDPSTGINYVELAGNWYPSITQTNMSKVEYGYKYQAHKIVFNGPLRCQFEKEIFSVCIEKADKPCYGTHYGFTMIRRASVMPYTDGWLLNKVPGYKENKLSYWEWDVNPREFAIEYVDLVEDEEVEFWIIAASTHAGVTLFFLIVNMCLWCSSRPDNNEEAEPKVECEPSSEMDTTSPDTN